MLLENARLLVSFEKQQFNRQKFLFQFKLNLELGATYFMKQIEPILSTNRNKRENISFSFFPYNLGELASQIYTLTIDFSD